MALSAEFRAHQRDLDQLVNAAQGDLAVIFRQVEDAEDVRDGLMDLLPGLVQVYGSAAAILAVDWYDELRAASDLPGSFEAIAADLPEAARTDALAKWAVGPLFGADPRPGVALSNVAGGLQRIIYDADRDTLGQSSVLDSRRVGWVRVGEGECDWCDQFLDGTVHYVDGYDFPAHDRCRCGVQPVFD